MDPQQQQAANMMAGMGMGLVAGFFLLWLAVIAFFIWLFWRIFTKAGMSGGLAFLTLIPGVGPIIVMCILAFGDWKVVPASAAVPQYGAFPPAGNTFPPSYPPNQFPPTGSSSQGPTQY